MSMYEELDKKILAMLDAADGRVPVFDIWLKFQDEVKNINVIDRRLQYLKKKNLVSNIRGLGWANEYYAFD